MFKPDKNSSGGPFRGVWIAALAVAALLGMFLLMSLMDIHFSSPTALLAVFLIVLGAALCAYLFPRIRDRLPQRALTCFALAALMGLVALFCLIANMQTLMLLLGLAAGLTGVLGLALSAGKRPDMRRINPFTPLLALAIILGAGCGLARDAVRPAEYDVENEPFNLIHPELQALLDNSDTRFASSITEFMQGMGPSYLNTILADQSFSLVLTDENHQVLETINHWQIGNAQSLRPLVRAVGDFGDQLVLLVDENGELLSTFWAEPHQVDGRYLTNTNAYSPLGGYRQTQPTSGAALSPETAEDELYAIYFPSFGSVIDEALYEFDLQRYLRAREDNYISEEERIDRLNRLLDYYHTEQLSASQLNATLDQLTEEEMDRLSEYAAWLMERRLDAMGNQHYAQLLTSADGTRHLYLLFQKPDDGMNNGNFYPAYRQYKAGHLLSERYYTIASCMVPVCIALLAFWVLVDARRRNHRHALLWAVLTLIGNVAALLIYLITRPAPSTMAAPKGSCPLCGARLRSDFIACPGCGILLRNKCKNCGHAIEKDWSFCPYCASEISAMSAEYIVNPPMTVSGPVEAEQDGE